jgi:ADP-heptose:LPS heptosyltransferase
MKTSTKIVIDKFAGGFIVFLLNSVDKLFRKRKKDSLNSPKSIVVCKFLGMGSIVQSTPLLLTLKKQFPEVRIIYLSTLSNKKFLQQINVIDELIIIDDKSFYSTIISTISSIKTLIVRKPEIFIDLETHSHFSKIFTIMSGALIKFGLVKNSKERNDVYTSTSELHKDLPVSESYLQMCKTIIKTELIHDLYKFHSSQEVFDRLIKTHGLPKKYIIINPNASDLRIERRWPQEKFSKLLEQISERYPEIKTILIGSKEEKNYVMQIAENIDSKYKNNVINTAGKLSIEELIALISKAALVITNDTGPMHLAFATQRPTIALFGPASPIQFGNHATVKAIYKKVACSPCVHDNITPPCHGNNICMKQIEVGEVFETVVMKLE